jgi:hypothetical protein
MSDFLRIFGWRGRESHDPPPPALEMVMVRKPLDRVLAFTGRTIDDVVNCPVAKRDVIGYYKLHRWVERQSEIVDLERQWNHLG